MRFSTSTTSVVRLCLLAGILALASSLAGCNGSGNALGPIGNFGPGGNNAQVRFVNGSPDAGPVQIFIDNTQQFCQNGTGSGCSVAYGQITTYAVNLSAGQHAIVLRDQNGNQITIPAGTLSLNSGFKYSVVLTGELHPSYGGAAPNLSITTFTDQPFNTPSGGAAVNFHYASPYMAATNASPLQFGYFLTANPSASAPLGSTDAFGSETTPQGLPAAALNAPITFFAGSATGPTATPGQIDATKCGSNSMPCSTGNLSLYLIDGPAASTSPSGTPPSSISSAANAGFVGVFD